MPGPFESMFYSFDIGPVHFISISTEFYYFLEFGFKMVANQFEWLQRDLEEATKLENRYGFLCLVFFFLLELAYCVLPRKGRNSIRNL